MWSFVLDALSRNSIGGSQAGGGRGEGGAGVARAGRPGREAVIGLPGIVSDHLRSAFDRASLTL